MKLEVDSRHADTFRNEGLAIKKKKDDGISRVMVTIIDVERVFASLIILLWNMEDST